MFYCCWLSGFHSFTLQYRKYSIVDGLFNQLYADVNVCIYVWDIICFALP